MKYKDICGESFLSMRVECGKCGYIFIDPEDQDLNYCPKCGHKLRRISAEIDGECVAAMLNKATEIERSGK